MKEAGSLLLGLVSMILLGCSSGGIEGTWEFDVESSQETNAPVLEASLRTRLAEDGNPEDLTDEDLAKLREFIAEETGKMNSNLASLQGGTISFQPDGTASLAQAGGKPESATWEMQEDRLVITEKSKRMARYRIEQVGRSLTLWQTLDGVEFALVYRRK